MRYPAKGWAGWDEQAAQAHSAPAVFGEPTRQTQTDVKRKIYLRCSVSTLDKHRQCFKRMKRNICQCCLLALDMTNMLPQKIMDVLVK